MGTLAQFRAAASTLFERYRLARMGGSFDGARDYNTVLGYDETISLLQYRYAYARGGISKRIVECYPRATWRGGVTLYEDEDPEVETAFEAAWKELNERLSIWTVLQRADTLAGLSTYSVILIGAPGDLQSELPKGSPDKLIYLQPFFAGGGPSSGVRNMTTSSGADCTISEFETDSQSARFGEPKFYQLKRTDITSPAFQRPVHHSRIIHIAEGCLDDNVFGIPILENIWDLLCDLKKVCGGGAEAFWLRANQGLNLNLDKDISMSDTDIANLKDEIDDYRHDISRVMRTRGMEVNTLGSDVANFNQPAEAILTQIAGSKGIPMRILTGSERGELASSQDAANFDTQVQDRRTGYAGPMIVRRLVDRLIKYNYLPTPKQYDIEWGVIETMTEMEKAQGAQTWSQTNASSPKPVYTTAEIREFWHGLEPLTPEQEAEMAPPTPEAPIDPSADPNAPVGESALLEPELTALGGVGSGVVGHTTPDENQTQPPREHSAAPEHVKTIEHILGSTAARKKATVKSLKKLKTSDLHRLKKAYEAIEAGHAAKAVKAEIAKRSDEEEVANEAPEEVTGEDEKAARARLKEKKLRTAGHGFSSTQLNLPDALAAKVLAFDVDPDDLAEEGREDSPHITVKYGLHTTDPDDVAEILAHFGAIDITLGETAVFTGEEYDVLYVEVESPDLERLNSLLSDELDVTDTHPVYTPHVCIAYLKPGRGEAYVDDETFVGETATLDAVEFSPKDTTLTLLAKEQALKTAANPNHEPAGTPEGGQFMSGSSSSAKGFPTGVRRATVSKRALDATIPSSITTDQILALESYIPDYDSINTGLRGKNNSRAESVAKVFAAVSQPLPSKTVLYRGLALDDDTRPMVDEWQVGQTIQMKGLVSTSSEPKDSLGWAGVIDDGSKILVDGEWRPSRGVDKGVVLEILPQRGVVMSAKLDTFLPKRRDDDDGSFGGENEVVLRHNSRYEVVGRLKDVRFAGAKGKFRVIQLREK
jgi:hypothetical protein